MSKICSKTSGGYTPVSLFVLGVFALLLIKLSVFHNDDVSLNDKYKLLPFVFINPICVRAGDPCARARVCVTHIIIVIITRRDIINTSAV